MKFIPGSSIDLVLTDPPYNANKRYEGFDDKKPEGEYISWMKERFGEMARVMKQGASLVFTYSSCGLELLGLFMPSDLRRVRSAVWHKPFSSAPFKNVGWSWHFEQIIWWAKGKPKVLPDTWSGEPDVIDVNPVSRVLDAGRKAEYVDHPCQKPLELWTYLVRRFSNEDDVVFDPFVGSGTTPVAAMRLKRRFIGIEIVPKYCRIARDRCFQEAQQPGFWSA